MVFRHVFFSSPTRFCIASVDHRRSGMLISLPDLWPKPRAKTPISGAAAEGEKSAEAGKAAQKRIVAMATLGLRRALPRLILEKNALFVGVKMPTER